MEIRCGVKKMDDKLKKYVHMLNATLCATTRTICCILENYQVSRAHSSVVLGMGRMSCVHGCGFTQTKTGINVPEVLVPFMGGTTFIPFTREPPTNYNKEKMARAEAKKAAATGGADAATAPAPAPAPAPKPVAASKPTPAPAPALPAKPKAAAPAPKAAPAVASGGDTLAALDAKLLHQSYVGGFTPSKADAAEFGKLSSVDETKYPNVARWHRHIASFTDAQRAAFA
jgi:hypothetical protein